MYQSRKGRKIGFALAAIVLLITVMAAVKAESWIGGLGHIEIVDQIPDELQYDHRNLDKVLRFHGWPVAVDQEQDKIYIPCKGENSELEDLAKEFSIELTDQQLYFLMTESDLEKAIRSGHEFELLIAGRDNCYTSYKVIFTDIPVLSIENHGTYLDEGNRENAAGDFRLWEPYSGENADWQPQLLQATWHRRGRTTKYAPKAPLKVNLHKMNGGPLNTSLLGMPGGKGWILNPLIRDDSKVREPLFMELWNDLARETVYNDRMSEGQYIELLADGTYAGIYLLQKPVTADYLGLDDSSVLIKSGPGLYEDDIDASIEILQTPMEHKKTVELFESVWNEGEYEKVHVDNLIDVNLFLQFASAYDNDYFFNNIFIFKKEAGNYRMTVLPWDTDMSFGLSWPDPDGPRSEVHNISVFSFEYDKSLQADLKRPETDGVRAIHPEFDDLTARRYAQLRQSVLSEEHILGKLDMLSEQVTDSGAMSREIQKWGLLYDGRDSVETVEQFIIERLQWLDHFYGIK